MTQRLLSPSFAGGEMSPAIYGRVDISKYSIGLRACRNFVVHRTGGVSNRPGFEFLGSVADHAFCPTLIPFRFNNTNQVCLLEFGHYTMRVWYRGGLVQNGAGQVVLIGTPYSASEAQTLSHAQSGDIMYLAHPAHPPAKLRRASWTDWSITTLTFTPSVTAPGAGTSGYTLATVRMPSATLTPSAIAGTIALSATAEISTTYGNATVNEFTRTITYNFGQTVTYGADAVLTYSYGESSTDVTVTTNGPSPAFQPADVGRIVTLHDGRVTIAAVAADLCSATGYVATTLGSTAAVTAGNWAIKAYLPTGGTGWTAALSGSTHSYSTAISYKVSVVSTSTGEESLASDAFTITGPTADDWPVGTKIILSGPAMADVAYYRVYKSDNGIYGYIGLASDSRFEDTNITPDISDTAPEAENPFDSAGDYPALVTFHQQRLVFAATTNAPNAVWMSRTGFFENMSKSTPTKDDDAITFTLGSGEINAIKGMVSVQDLIILTSGSENICNGGTSGGAITASSTGISVKPQSYWGSGGLAPLVSGNTCLFIQGLGAAVRDLFYDYSVDGFVGTDKSILARHLLDGYSITSWAYAQVPDSTFWMVRSDGALLSLTYFREQDIGAWALHTTEGAFERVAAVEGDDRHEVYAVVRRTINGQTRRYVERLASRTIITIGDAAFTDCHLVYTGAAATIIGGLSHLAGCTVGILADGNVLDDQIVSAGGTVTLARAASHVVVGLRYDRQSWIETLDVDLGMVQGLGSVQARRKTVPKLTLRVQSSREFLAGPDLDHLMLTKVTLGSYGAVPGLYTGDVDLATPPAWTSHGRMTIRPNGPVPLTILAIMPDLSIGG